MSLIDDYLADLPADQQEALERVRKIVHEFEPSVEETISYRIPTLRYKQKNLVHFAAFKDHLSLFPTGKPPQMIKEKLSGFRVSKGTVQFTVDHQIPEELIIEMLAIRKADIDKE